MKEEYKRNMLVATIGYCVAAWIIIPMFVGLMLYSPQFGLSEDVPVFFKQMVWLMIPLSFAGTIVFIAETIKVYKIKEAET